MNETKTPELNVYGEQLPKGLTLGKLNEMFSIARSEYSKAHARARRVDMLDRNKLWESINARFPKYQLLPQTNHVSYVKNNILASVYTVGKSAQLSCTSEQDAQLIDNLNIALEEIWRLNDVASYQMEAGERAALMNLGITQVGWDNSIIQGSETTFKNGEICLKNIDPLKYYRDPFAKSLDTAQFVVTWEHLHESVIRANKNYRDKFNAYKEACKANLIGGNISTLEAKTDKVTQVPGNRPGYHTVYTYWVRTDDGNISEIHVIDNRFVLRVVEKIKPNMFPFAELYCNLPAGDLLGTSEPMKIADNSIVYNIMNSIIETSEYKNQRPPRFVNGESGLNLNAFVKNGNDADRTFVVHGDASKAVHYQQFPTPGVTAIQGMSLLQQDIQAISGVDGKYTGRDTGSVLTTGGVEAMFDQATLIDLPTITLYDRYCTRLSQLIIQNYIIHSPVSRNYLVQRDDNKYEMVTVDFPEIPDDILLDYSINISSELPKNKARMAEAANELMEMQMQYAGAGIDVDLIQPEEWLKFQDIPFKEYFSDRMKIQRLTNWQKLVGQIVAEYAALVDNGMASADAINTTAQTIQQQQSGQGNVDMEEIAQNAQIF